VAHRRRWQQRRPGSLGLQVRRHSAGGSQTSYTRVSNIKFEESKAPCQPQMRRALPVPRAPTHERRSACIRCGRDEQQIRTSYVNNNIVASHAFVAMRLAVGVITFQHAKPPVPVNDKRLA